MKCKCGCGLDAPIADRTDRKRGRVRGEPLRFVHGHNTRKFWEPPTEAWCKTCQTTKPAGDFYADATRSSGLGSQCRECRKIASAQRYKEKTALLRAQSEAWKKAHPDEYRRTHLEGSHRRRARLKERIVEKIDPWAIYERDGGKCHICGEHVPKEVMSLDHLVPIAKGGDHIVLNVRLAHLKCNIKRGAGRTPAQLILL